MTARVLQMHLYSAWALMYVMLLGDIKLKRIFRRQPPSLYH
jgi:hypothetical protein